MMESTSYLGTNERGKNHCEFDLAEAVIALRVNITLTKLVPTINYAQTESKSHSCEPTNQEKEGVSNGSLTALIAISAVGMLMLFGIVMMDAPPG